MLKKLHYIAEYGERSVNGQILALIRSCIEKFEEKHGGIGGAICPDVNVKPARKN